jgi:predicted ester cyclase
MGGKMSVEENKELVNRYYQESNAYGGDPDKSQGLISTYIDSKTIFHSIAGEKNLVQSADFFTAFYRGFPDMKWAIQDVIAEGDKIVVRYTWTGTQTGEWMGKAPTGKKYRQPGMVIYRIAGGKIVEAWTFNDPMKEA